MGLDQLQQALADAAVEVRGSAYCKYSGFAVGSAVRTTGGIIFTGCNVENSSFGLTTCAERNAIAAAVAAGMQPGELAAVAVTGDREPVLTPCGACRQVISEFAAPGCEVLCLGTSGGFELFTLEDLLPRQFRLKDS